MLEWCEHTSTINYTVGTVGWNKHNATIKYTVDMVDLSEHTLPSSKQ